MENRFSTAGRLNRAKNQYENILLGLHLPNDNNDDEILFPSRNLAHLPVPDPVSESFEEDVDVEDIIVNQQVSTLRILDWNSRCGESVLCRLKLNP